MILQGALAVGAARILVSSSNIMKEISHSGNLSFFLSSKSFTHIPYLHICIYTCIWANFYTNMADLAMIILYSITGIITALFLGIIVTGAVRAHRHPERYGPRRVAGRPRQSRARGIARAMLEGIPIVKFGDEPHADTVDAAKRDIEMASTEQDGREHSPPRSENDAEVGETTPHETEAPAIEQEANRPKSTVLEPRPDAAPDAGNFSCPICTDDFIKGQDLRVLPCYHQFHPECVDPWLVNVSGTCPLWYATISIEYTKCDSKC